MAASLEDLFTACTLQTSVPSVTVEYPPLDADTWLDSLTNARVDRKQAFFDEQLSTYLTLQIPASSKDTAAPSQPPKDVLSLLTHVQVLLEASYIPQVDQTPEPPQTAFLSAPPRGSSQAKLDPKGLHHPSIFPPSTPNPTPATVDGDQRYVRSEGTTFASKVWGEDTGRTSTESVHLLYSSKRQEWIAMYRLVLVVAFIPLPVADPLLCLTMSTTLRQSPATITRPDHPLRSYFATIGAASLLDPPAASETLRDSRAERLQMSVNEISGFEEVNLLSGLAAGPSFGLRDRPELNVPSTRLGPATRKELFSLSSTPVALNLPTSSSPIVASSASVNTLRKSFRKTMGTASGFRVRMRTTFVPPIMMSGEEDSSAQQPFEASSGERTVVLCIEVENSDDSNSGTGFAVESVKATVSGEGAIAHLINGAHGIAAKDAESQMFPLLLQPNAQHNLLYAVSFLQSPDAEQASAEGPVADSTLRRAVVIDISGRPFYELSSSEISYPTSAFSSRWNCVLDLASDQTPSIQIDPLDHSHPSAMFFNTFPEPASPFPAASPRHPPPISPRTVESPVVTTLAAAGKRHTVSGPVPSALKKAALANYRASTSALQHRDDLRTPPPLSSASNDSSAFSPPLNHPGPRTPGPHTPSQHDFSHFQLGPSQLASFPPQTPAYPLFTSQQSHFPMSPMSQSPIQSSQRLGLLGPPIDIRRERGSFSHAMVPPTPGPLVQPGFPSHDGGYFELQHHRGNETVVVSIGLLPSSNDGRDHKIIPFDYFAIDIFVYNQSMSTKRFEVCYPLKRKKALNAGRGAVSPTVGILPLDNRVRIGPLLPGSCQSVRMQFVALLPGVHSLDTLTLTDSDSDISTNLRSVVDVVVRDTREGHSSAYQ